MLSRTVWTSVAEFQLSRVSRSRGIDLSVAVQLDGSGVVLSQGRGRASVETSRQITQTHAYC